MPAGLLLADRRSLAIMTLPLERLSISLSVVPSAAALACYRTQVVYDSKKFVQKTSYVENCPLASKYCIQQEYTSRGLWAHSCSTGYNNCSTLNVDRTNRDTIGEYVYSCCAMDRCNKKQVKLAPEVFANPVLARPECDQWKPRDYDQRGAGNATLAKDLKQTYDSSRKDQRSNWTLNVQPPTANRWLYSQDTSIPDCYTVSGLISKGFCGVRYDLDQVIGSIHQLSCLWDFPKFFGPTSLPPLLFCPTLL
jgi:hypothetical protein